jgi:hypothetical protein
MTMKAELWDQIQAAKGQGTAKQVAEQFGVHPSMIGAVWNGERRRPGWIQDRTKQRNAAAQQERERSPWTPNAVGNGNGQGSRCGLSTIERVDLFHAQGDVCYLCEEPVDFDLTYVEHDHSHQDCGGNGCPRCVRGLCCSSCNSRIARAHDDPARLRLIADNLERAIEQTRDKW